MPLLIQIYTSQLNLTSSLSFLLSYGLAQLPNQNNAPLNMAHRQLAEKYAKQLNDANQRIMVLETTVADGEDRLAQAKYTADPTAEQQAPEVTTLREQLADAAQTIEKLADAVAVKNGELQTITDRANADGASATATALKLQTQLKVAEQSTQQSNFVDRCRGRTSLADQQLDGQRLNQLTQENAKLTQQNDVLARKLWQHEAAMGTQARVGYESSDGFKSLVKERATLRGQITKLKASQVQLKEELSILRRANDDKDNQGDIATKEEVSKLKRSLYLELKRR